MKRRSKTFPAETSSVSGARDFVRDVISNLGQDVPDAILLTSELVSNAAEHASTEIEVVVCVDDETLRVEVHDGFTMTDAFRVLTETEVQTVDSRARQGRGLVMVRGIAARFGVLDKGEDGKAVWFEMLRAGPLESNLIKNPDLMTFSRRWAPLLHMVSGRQSHSSGDDPGEVVSPWCAGSVGVGDIGLDALGIGALMTQRINEGWFDALPPAVNVQHSADFAGHSSSADRPVTLRRINA